MQQTHESRCPMRQKVRALAKFQMQRLVSRRRATQDRERMRAPRGRAASAVVEPIAPVSRIALDPQPILGLPGYRTQAGHTGLDPIESVSEVAYLQGKFIRRFITGQLRTQQPLYLVAMALAGGILIAPFVMCLGASFIGGWTMSNLWLMLGLAPFALVGWVLWINVNLSVRALSH